MLTLEKKKKPVVLIEEVEGLLCFMEECPKLVSGKNEKEVSLAREEICERHEISVNSLVFPNQIGGDKIVEVFEKDRGASILSSNKGPIEDTDGLFTRDYGVFLVAYAADCPIVVYYDPVKKVCGVAHAGYEGTGKRLPGKMVDFFIANGSKSSDIRVTICPSALACCYDVVNAVDKDYPEPCRWKRFKSEFGEGSVRMAFNPKTKKSGAFLDLLFCNKQSLLRRGILEENIDASHCICTICSGLPSHYREREKRTRTLLAVVGMQ
ncbi:MAG: hypothetical protein G01um101418_36 [Parcubacteria group bacterium Gr01-1014_18]|nr:MAG: hypothetical protein Greene041636_36 [Parcubacteria group bacterium Greene0416_36]TSC81542.1 MAG: hypothetical protein G01um101418_36 [Parcubacteria group bacterium Gr01-1014_18]TSC99647.1 MAG: hypothetical protein Greene101420_51 [Parcubacteria group bacterium Greene1014_20]TSD07098.1 MAG: hypothetical protein Greene07142_410 [Parcubacteria group bacterium Greene0714_2]